MCGLVSRFGEKGERVERVVLVSMHCPVPTTWPSVGSRSVADRKTPHSGPQFSHRAGAPPPSTGMHGLPLGRPSEVVDADAGSLGGTGEDAVVIGKRPVGELPCGSLHRAQTSVDAHEPRPGAVDGAGPHQVLAPAAKHGKQTERTKKHEKQRAVSY